jgi:hypothetical protein
MTSDLRIRPNSATWQFVGTDPGIPGSARDRDWRRVRAARVSLTVARIEFDIRTDAPAEAIRTALLDFSERRPELCRGSLRTSTKSTRWGIHGPRSARATAGRSGCVSATTGRCPAESSAPPSTAASPRRPTGCERADAIDILRGRGYFSPVPGLGRLS